MRPTLFEFTLPVIGEVSFPAYLTLVLTGFVIATLVARRAAERDGLDGQTIVDLAILMLLLGVLGARILAVATDGKFTDFVHLCTDPHKVAATDAQARLCTTDDQCGFDYLCDVTAREATLAGERATMCYPPRDCLAVLKFWQGGLTFYGGLVLAALGAVWFCRRKGLDFLRVADILAPSVLIGQSIGRVGCLLEGCCYGAATDGPLGMTLGHRGSVHPTQLYESIATLVLAIALTALLRRKGDRPHGAVFGWMLLSYGVVRAVIEVFRADPRGALGPLSTSQLIAIPLVLLGAALVWRAARGARRRSQELSSRENRANETS